MTNFYLTDCVDHSLITFHKNDFENIHEIKIQSLTMDSRKANEKSLFIATPSARIQDNIKNARDNGCFIFLVQGEYNILLEGYKNIIILNAPNAYESASLLAAKFFAYKAPENIVYITGTNGKSSTVSLLRQFWEKSGKKSASLGTLGLISLDRDIESMQMPYLTTPDAISYHRLLAFLESSGYTHLACEASSHGLDQYRLDHVPVKSAGFLNLSQDHLDYHQTMEKYFFAKSTLFSRVLQKGGFAILNKDSSCFGDLKNIAEKREQKILIFSQQQEADFYVQKRFIQQNAFVLTFCFLGKVFENIPFKLFGDFQIENLLCAAANAYATGVSLEELVAIIPTLENISGRMEYVASKNGGDIFVDFAHTPDALMNILKTVRSYHPKKIRLVFGCGGDRDPTKRPLMGKIAADLADVVYITDDNPRFEDPQKIRQDILTEVPAAFEVDGRSKAIQQAIDDLNSGEILIIAGKGHETGQIIKDISYPFSDKEEVLKYIHK